MSIRSALVTGGGAGIGRAIALALADVCTGVAVLDVNLDGALSTRDEILRKGNKALALHGAIENRGQVEQAYATLDKEWGGVDVLINNVGITVIKPTLELTTGEWQRTIDINLNGLFYVSQEAGRRMVKQRSGCIVNIGSIYSLMAAPHRLTYCTTKAAIVMMTKCLAVEWAEFGVRVNAVAPGYIKTEVTAALERAGKYDPIAVVKRTPMNRFGTPEEIANAVKFLVSDQAMYITGQVLGVDGGWTAYGYV